MLFSLESRTENQQRQKQNMNRHERKKENRQVLINKFLTKKEHNEIFILKGKRLKF